MQRLHTDHRLLCPMYHIVLYIVHSRAAKYDHYLKSMKIYLHVKIIYKKYIHYINTLHKATFHINIK